MAVTAVWYAKAFVTTFNKEVDFSAGANIKATLHTSSYTIDQALHDYFNDLTNQLSTANGYTASTGANDGFAVVSPTVTSSSLVITLDSADPAWTATGAGFTARILVLSDQTAATSASDPLIIETNFGADNTASGGGTFTYVVAATGWGTITVS